MPKRFGGSGVDAPVLERIGSLDVDVELTDKLGGDSETRPAVGRSSGQNLSTTSAVLRLKASLVVPKDHTVLS